MSDTILTAEEWEAASMASMLPALVSDKERSAAARSLRLHDAALRSRLAEAEANIARAIVLGEAAAANADANYMERCIVEGRLAEAVELLRALRLDDCECSDPVLLVRVGAFIEAHGSSPTG